MDSSRLSVSLPKDGSKAGFRNVGVLKCFKNFRRWPKYKEEEEDGANEIQTNFKALYFEIREEVRK